MAQDVTLEIKGLEQLLKALKAKPPQARVGILGGRNNRMIEDQRSGRASAAVGNAEIGAAHEFGTTTLPKRSFLITPITENLQKEMENAHSLDRDVLSDVIKSGSVKPWVDKITKMAEDISIGAFDTQGYGKWAPWKNPNYTNNTGQVLLDSQQLRNSITSEVRG